MQAKKWDYIRPYINSSDGKPKSYIENVHHIYPTSRLWSQIEDNKVRLYESLHNARHRVYGNATPIEQLDQRLHINYTALSKEFIKDFLALIQTSEDEYYYKNGIYLKK